MHYTSIALITLLGTASLAAQAADAPALCATAEQAAPVRALYATPPVPPPFMAGAKLGLPDAIVLSALPADSVVGTAASAFLPVWESLQAWDRALTLVIKAGQIFEVNGRIPGGEPSKISQNFNLKDQSAGLSGHLRPDLLSAIYAVSLTGREGPIRGVMFLDAAGATAFSVFLPEAGKPTAAEIAEFEKTRALIAAQPRLCPAP